MGAICLYGLNARHEKGIYWKDACGFNGEMDQLDCFHATHYTLEDLVRAVGWSICKRSARRVLSSLVCFVNCRLFATQPVACCLNGHNSGKSGVARTKAASQMEHTFQWHELKPGLLLGWWGSDRPTVTRSQLSHWNAREQEVEVECGARGRGRRSESCDDQICHYHWVTRPNYGNVSHLRQLQPEPWQIVCCLCVFTAFYNSLCCTTDGQCPRDVYLSRWVIGIIYWM